MRPLLGPITLSRTIFLCCDIQERFRTVVPKFDKTVFVAQRFLDFASMFSADEAGFIATEQYPKGLGHIVAEIGLDAALAAKRADGRDGLPAVSVHEKTAFSMITEPIYQLTNSRAHSFVLFGLETHVCVLQTVESLVKMNNKNRVFIAADGVASQREEDRVVALQTMQHMSDRVVISTSESILLQLIRDASHPQFKATSALLKAKPPDP